MRNRILPMNETWLCAYRRLPGDLLTLKLPSPSLTLEAVPNDRTGIGKTRLDAINIGRCSD